MNEYKPSILKKEENTIYDKYASLQVKYHTLNTEKETLEQIIKKDCKMIEMLGQGLQNKYAIGNS